VGVPLAHLVSETPGGTAGSVRPADNMPHVLVISFIGYE
ncbi:Serine/threonine protein kinase, partial [Giardia duodenalis]